MITRRIILAGFAVAASGLTSHASAAETPYTQEAFAAAQKAGKQILVAVHADWCPVCKQQVPILDRMSKDAKFKHFTFLRVDFDGQKPIVREFGVRQQSTLIVFRGEKEVGRSTGETKPEAIEQLLAKGL
ncbi:thioredoxin family protein [Roseiarcaceae bacterium H3SJ34-1]|uniref:thioredoxin family protein n=1 Tax=Terripilifer ovatus TaxID=3032367 RepID=UPI003AB93CD6|nr:thioredoxin family protein [Roseiarcaceae bacterium H3SJ34-1]